MKKSVAVAVFLLAWSTLLGTTPAWALTADQEAKLLASDGGPHDQLGYSVSVDGDTAIIGAVGTSSHPRPGSAYVFTRTAGEWTEQCKIVASDGEDDDRFGVSVSIDGETAVIGAYFDDDGDYFGSAYVFTRAGGVWTQQAKLLPSDSTSAYFGYTVALDGDTTVIGAYGDDDNGLESGSAYVFTRVGGVWTEKAKLLPADGAYFDHFGRSVALHGDTAVIGAELDDGDATNSGSAYIFTLVGSVWTEQARLLPADGAFSDHFGWSVALDGDTAVIGTEAASAYVFTRTAGVWTEQAKLLASDAGPGDRFGWSVALDGDTAVIGDKYDDDHGMNSGSAYVFTRMGSVWSEQAKLLAADGVSWDLLGWSVALDDGAVLLGAVGNNEYGLDSGSAYVFRLITVCGDGTLDPGEECDDGNNDDGDGCAADCTIEVDVPATTGIGVILLVLALGGTAAYFMRRHGN